MSQLFKNAVSYLSGGDTDSFVGTSIDIETHKLTIKGIIGDGGFGKVYRVTNLKDGSDFALKRLFVPESSIKRIQRELVIHTKVTGHPNICRFISGAAHPLPERRGFAEYLILLEFCPGSLSSIIRVAGTKLFSSSEVLRLFYGVCQAVNHLHTSSPPVIHRDIKAENVILSSSGVVKLCDFGSATTTVVRPDEDWSAQQRAMLEDEVQCSTTPCYRAPEMIDYYSNYEIGTKSDVWALGCFLYFICYFDLPYDDNRLAIVNAKYKTPNEHLVMFAPFVAIFRNVFKTNPDSRPTTAQIICLLENISKEKGIDPNLPPFEDVRIRQTENVAPSVPNEPCQGSQLNSRSSWIGYLKGGAESILKEAKSASEKVVGAVVQASSLYSNEKLDEGQLIVTHVTSRIMAISFPDPNMVDTVEEMVRQRYGNSAYFINLTENDYYKECFGGRVLNSGWNPLFPPSMTSLCHVVGVMDRWLLVAPENVLVVHCQQGTGNTALLLASYFLACGLYKSSSSALQYYANCRYLASPSSGGIITASQKRYVEYIESMLYNPAVQIHSNTVILVDLSLSSAPLFSVNRSNCKPFVEVFEDGKKILSTLREPDVMRTYTTEDGPVVLPINMGVCGDIRVAVYHARNFIGGKMSAIKMFQLCFNTAFLDPECACLKLPRSRLDGIARNESKFVEPFTATISLSVQPGNNTSRDHTSRDNTSRDHTSRDSPYLIATSSLGIKPPVCCTSNEEFNRIVSKIPDKGFKKSDSRTSSISNVTKPKDMVFEDELEDSFDVSGNNKRENKLINLMGSAAEEKPTPMSDPMSRKSPSKRENSVLLDFLAPATTTMVQSSSAPNLAEMATKPHSTSSGQVSPNSDDFSNFFTVAPTTVSPQPPVHKRNQSINLMDIKSVEDDLMNRFDLMGKPKVAAPEQEPPVTVTPTPTMMFDPFGSSESARTAGPPQPPPPQDPFLTPVQPGTQSYTNHMASPIRPQKLGSMSGNNSPVTSRSRNVSPRASPSLTRRNNDPFSDFVLDTKTSQIHFEKPIVSQPSPQSTSAHPKQASHHPLSYGSRPNYFASSYSAGSVFGGDSKPRQQHHSPATNDKFGDLLSGQQFTSHAQAAKQQTLLQQRRDELEKTMDPIKLKLLDWTKGKEGNIRALLSSLGDVLWDGETRWPKPGMNLMIEPVQVKKMYRNASRVVHPDKQVGTPQEDLAKAIQTELNDAYTSFEEAELQ